MGLGIRDHIPEGLTILFDAPQRRGKSLAMVLFAYEAYRKGRTVFSNIQLGFPHTPLNFEELRLGEGGGGESPFWNGHVCIDEWNFMFDGRASMSKSNREFSAYLLQQKKQGCNLTGTTHNVDYLDLRLRQNYDLRIVPQTLRVNPLTNRLEPSHPHRPEYLRMDVFNGPLQPRIRKKIVVPVDKVLGMYDTGATYDPFKKPESTESGPNVLPESRW